MPIYEYQCEACGHKLEAMQKVSDPPLKTCEHCHKNKLQKLISASGFQLKGGGWYATDYSGKGKKKDKKDDNSVGEVKSETKSTSSSDSSTDKSDN